MTARLASRLVLGRLMWGLLIALLLLGGLRAAADAIEPDNPGLSDRPCPPPGTGTAATLKVALLVLAGRPPALRDWADLCFYQDRNRALAASGRWPSAVFIGDSITQYWGMADPALFAGENLNSGIAGQNSGQVLLRMMPDALALRPRIVHLLVGVNDVRGVAGPARPEDYRNNIGAMVALAQGSGAVVIIGLMPPATGKPADKAQGTSARILALNSWLRALAREKDLVLADYWTALAGPDGTQRPAFTVDGTHPSLAGYEAMKPVALAALAEANRRLAARKH